MTTFKKKIVGVSLAVVLAFGGAAVVGTPASAAYFGAYITHCSGAKKVTAEGIKDRGGNMKIAVPGRTFYTSDSRVIYAKLPGTANSGVWVVNGSTATMGKGYCL